MTIDTLQTLEVIETLENFISKIRPHEHIRKELDIGYTIDDQSIIIFEIRPQGNKPEIIHQYLVAKTTFVKAKNHWKVFWRRADSKWHNYTPNPFVLTIKEFTKLVEEDKLNCFWG
jgi:hypothetical protein